MHDNRKHIAFRNLNFETFQVARWSSEDSNDPNSTWELLLEDYSYSRKYLFVSYSDEGLLTAMGIMKTMTYNAAGLVNDFPQIHGLLPSNAYKERYP